ncbi:MAG: hypothetical protein ACYCV5_06470 [Acidimicrobiales bacterium]
MPEPAAAVVPGSATSMTGLPGVRTPTRPAPRALRPVSFSPTVVLAKAEAFDACQALADAGGRLVRFGCTDEAAALAGLFELLERRLTDRG